MKGWYGRAWLLYLLWFDFGLTQFCPLDAYFFENDAICIWLTETKEDTAHITQSCDQDGGSLIDIGNAGLQAFIIHKLPLVSILYWISQIDVNVSGCYALLTTQPYKVEPVECDQSLHGICFKPLECPPAALYIHETDTCYWVDNTLQPAWLSQKSCESQNGSLAVIPTPTVMNYIIDNYTSMILDAVATSKSDGLWIGYTDCAVEGVFRTFDGKVATWFSWLLRQPNDDVQVGDQDCVIMSARGLNKWEDKACETPRIALCYRMFSGNGTNTTGEDPCPGATSTVTSPIETETTSLMTPEVTPPLITAAAATTSLNTAAETTSLNTAAATTSLNTAAATTSFMTTAATASLNTAATTSLSTAAATTSLMTTAATTSLNTAAATTFAGNTSDSKCPVCKCGHNQNVLTAEELLEHLARLRLDTHIYYKNTSAYRRRHVSVYEPRITAKYMGVTAGAVLVAVVLCLVILDLKSCRAKQRPTLDRLVRRL